MRVDLQCALAGVTGAALLVGCGAPAQGGQVPAPSASAAVPAKVLPPPGLGDGQWGEFVSKRFGARVPLPDGRGWRIDDHSGNWLSAMHGASGSMLLVRVWREDDIMNRQRCEERARLWRKLPERGVAEIMETRPLKVPPEFDTVVDIGIVPAPPHAKSDAAIDAFAMAFGARVRRCFAYIFTTNARGGTALAAVGERLGTMVQGSLEKLVLESDLEPRIGREPEPSRGP